ncbi:hypothetical protein IW15_22245 [Chryseobacterium soli]|uniref:Cell wall anchor protein n=1 Tax=Chryseobacterium soli TaxID=445961 RepID=A0A085ZZB7_9FLAO|nr:hypothetical protein [Chryseobacterium soli]KFF09781.1 hypothetical protein IW15_22245 [Chryseobacterium soli]
MKNNIILLGAVLISGIAFSQVGINTDAPKATLDVVGKATDTSSLDGIIAPRLTGVQLRAKTYTTDQTGTLVYVTTADTAPAGQTVNVTSIGYFYFDGAVWQKVGNGAAAPVNIYNANGTLTSGRTLTQNGFSLAFLGTNQSTSFFPNNGISQTGIAGGKRASITLTSNDNNSDGVSSNMQLFQDPEQLSQIIVGSDSRGLSIGTSFTTQPAPITFITNTGNTNGTERARITPTGNFGINTQGFASEKLDVNGIARIRTLPLNGITNAINTTSGGTASASQDQTFTATRTVVADANGVLGYVTGLPTTGGGTPPTGSINVGQTISAVYSVPNATATAGSGAFRLGAYATANGLTALPSLDGIQIDLLGYDANYYVPIIINTASTAQLVSLQSFATVVNSNKTLLNQSLSPCPFAANTFTSNLWAGNVTSGWLSVDNDNIVYWNTANAEVETTNVQVQVDANTYRWYEFKWWCMEVSGFKKIFLSVTRKA